MSNQFYLGNVAAVNGLLRDEILGTIIDADYEVVAVEGLGLAKHGHLGLAFGHSFGLHFVYGPVQAVHATEDRA